MVWKMGCTIFNSSVALARPRMGIGGHEIERLGNSSRHALFLLRCEACPIQTSNDIQVSLVNQRSKTVP